MRVGRLRGCHLPFVVSFRAGRTSLAGVCWIFVSNFELVLTGASCALYLHLFSHTDRSLGLESPRRVDKDSRIDCERLRVCYQFDDVSHDARPVFPTDATSFWFLSILRALQMAQICDGGGCRSDSWQRWGMDYVNPQRYIPPIFHTSVDVEQCLLTHSRPETQWRCWRTRHYSYMHHHCSALSFPSTSFNVLVPPVLFTLVQCNNALSICSTVAHNNCRL